MQKTIMNRSLAKALMEAGMQHFDAGGTALPQATTIGGTQSAAAGNAASSLANPITGLTTNLNPMNGLANAGALAQGFASDFTAQNGYQAQLAPTDYTNYQGTIGQAQQQALSGYQNAQQIQGQQQGLANALLAQSQGQGPNPAQSALNASTGQNVATQAALMAGQRGSAANPALLARQAAQQGASTQQQAVGQGATLQAQQQLAAEQTLQQQQANLANTNVSEQNANNSILGTAGGLQNTQNANSISNYGMAQGINSQVAQNNANAVNKTEGGLLGGASSILSMLSKGGRVGKDGMQRFDSGGVAQVSTPNLSNDAAVAAGSSSGGGGGGGAGIGSLLALLSQGGQVEPVKSAAVTGTSKLNYNHYPSHLKAMADMYHPGKFAKGGPIDYRSGGHVPGKAAVKGDSSKNDVVPAMLSPGEEVLPRSITQSANAPQKAAEFVRHLQDKDNKQPVQGYVKGARSKKSLKDRVAKLEKLCYGGAA